MENEELELTKIELLEESGNDLCDQVEANKMKIIKTTVYEKFCKILGREIVKPEKEEKPKEPKFKYECECKKFTLKFEINADCPDCGQEFIVTEKE